MPDLDIDRYAQTMKQLAISVTDANPMTAGRRVQRVNSTQMHNVRVVSGTNNVTLILQESGLYIKGFQNDNGTFYFKTNPATIGGKALSFSCSYVGSNSMGIYEIGSDAVKTTQRSKHSINQAIIDLAAFNGGTDNGLKVPLALMVMLISESIRFTVVYDLMVEVCKGAGKTYCFKDVQTWVQAWQGISVGSVPTGTHQAHLFTWYS